MIFSFATFIYHAFTCLAYLSPLVGSLLADSYLGRFKVILYGSSIYVLGHVLLSFGAVPTMSLGTYWDGPILAREAYQEVIGFRSAVPVRLRWPLRDSLGDRSHQTLRFGVCC